VCGGNEEVKKQYVFRYKKNSWVYAHFFVLREEVRGATPLSPGPDFEQWSLCFIAGGPLASEPMEGGTTCPYCIKRISEHGYRVLSDLQHMPLDFILGVEEEQ
jgi:hypothetical protein